MMDEGLTIDCNASGYLYSTCKLWSILYLGTLQLLKQRELWLREREREREKERDREWDRERVKTRKDEKARTNGEKGLRSKNKNSGESEKGSFLKPRNVWRAKNYFFSKTSKDNFENWSRIEMKWNPFRLDLLCLHPIWRFFSKQKGKNSL